MRPALAKGGVITVVTDNLWYARLLVRIVAGINAADKRGGYASVKPASGAKLLEESRGITLHQGAPGPECGHSAEASSYFDRLWRRGISKHSHKQERFFLCIRRGKGDA
jgi:hypothetical protein